MFSGDVRILIVDDSYVVRAELKKLLRELGYEKVHEAVNGADAIQKLKIADNSGTSIQLIMCDWQMPEISGLELFKMIRESKQWENVPFLFMTSHTSLHDVYTAAAAGIENFVVKPLEKEKLRAKIDSLYRNSLSKLAKSLAHAFQDSPLSTKKKSG